MNASGFASHNETWMAGQISRRPTVPFDFRPWMHLLKHSTWFQLELVSFLMLKKVLQHMKWSRVRRCCHNSDSTGRRLRLSSRKKNFGMYSFSSDCGKTKPRPFECLCWVRVSNYCSILNTMKFSVWSSSYLSRTTSISSLDVWGLHNLFVINVLKGAARAFPPPISKGYFLNSSPKFQCLHQVPHQPMHLWRLPSNALWFSMLFVHSCRLQLEPLACTR